jgi:hypothetical protein
MTDEKLQRSLSSGGAHHLLARMVGDWTGRAKTWFEPDKLADDSPISGKIRTGLEGRFAIHEYEGTVMGGRLLGLAIHGYDLRRGRFTMSWVDSFHTGTEIMTSEGASEPAGERFSVLGHYGDPPWGWRTQVEFPSPDRLLITHFNITPQGGESKAVEIGYRRRA